MPYERKELLQLGYTTFRLRHTQRMATRFGKNCHSTRRGPTSTVGLRVVGSALTAWQWALGAASRPYRRRASGSESGETQTHCRRGESRDSCGGRGGSLPCTNTKSP